MKTPDRGELNTWQSRTALAISFTVMIMVIAGLVLAGLAMTANATTTIGITLSKSCQLSLTCINYSTLATQFDNTNQGISGYFDLDGFRGKPQYQNHWKLYEFSRFPVIIAIDPDARWIPNLNYHITVVPSHFTYFKAPDMKVFNNTRIERVDSYIDSCVEATIYWSLVQATLNHLLSKCLITEYNATKVIAMPYIPYEMADSPSYKYSQWMAKSIRDCKVRC